MNCAACGGVLLPEDRVAGISVFVMGDEYVYSYWLCAPCQQYTVRAYHDRFIGEDSVGVMGPFPKEMGDRAVALIRACPQPLDKWCECASHRAMYYGVPSPDAAG